MSFFLNDKAEAAGVKVIQPLVDISTVGVYPGKNADVKHLPRVVVWADGDGDEDPKGTGNFWVSLEFEIKSRSQGTDVDGVAALPSDQALVDAVFLQLLDDGLEAALSAAVPDFTVFPNGIFREAPRRGYDEAGVWTDSMRLRIYCCGSAIAP